MYFHLYYFRLVFLRLSLLPKETPLPAVSVLMAARNEADNLPALLPIICHQTYPQYEVIIVNDRSTDDTAHILDNYTVLADCSYKVIHIKDVPKDINPKKNALQVAIAHSQYEWLLLTDADCLPANQEWISHMMRSRKNNEIKIVVGIAPYLPIPKKEDGILSQFIQYETFYTALQYTGFALAGKPYMGIGRNLLYHKSLFEQVGGFGRFLHTTGGDDDLFINQVATSKNTSVALEGGFVTSKSSETWRTWYAQKHRHLSVGKHYKMADQLRLGILYFSQGGIWLSFLVSLCYLPTFYAWISMMLFCVRSKIIWQDYQKLTKRLNCHVKPLYLRLFDVIFIPYLFIMGFVIQFNKSIKWKN